MCSMWSRRWHQLGPPSPQTPRGCRGILYIEYAPARLQLPRASFRLRSDPRVSSCIGIGIAVTAPQTRALAAGWRWQCCQPLPALLALWLDCLFAAALPTRARGHRRRDQQHSCRHSWSPLMEPDLWPPQKHARFEAALKENPKIRGEASERRWERVAAGVEGTTATECQRYFKLVREHVKQRAQRQQQQREPQPQPQPQPEPEPAAQQSRHPHRRAAAQKGGKAGATRHPQTSQTTASAVVALDTSNAQQEKRTMRPMSSRVVAKWWQRLDDAVHPISLHPLAQLHYPPYELRNGAAGEPATFFDGRVLAHYLVSTGNFKHPITRRDLTGKECRYRTAIPPLHHSALCRPECPPGSCSTLPLICAPARYCAAHLLTQSLVGPLLSGTSTLTCSCII